jgi:hypothetical protein
VRNVIVVALATIAAGHSTDLSNKPAQREVEVIGTEYAFTAPHELPSGRTLFRFRNRGKVTHELNIALLKRGVTISQFIDSAKADKPQMVMVEGPVGVLFADPGKASAFALSTDLLPGRDYAVQCIFRDSAAAPKHLAMGMYSVIHVKAEKPASRTAPVKRDTVVGVDYAYKYPRTVSPGHHSFVFRDEGKVRHEMSLLLLKKGATLDSLLAIDKAGGDVFSIVESGDGLLHSRPGETALGALEVDMLPGREYVIFCGFRDDEKSPPHFKLGMYGSIKVAPAATGP